MTYGEQKLASAYMEAKSYGQEAEVGFWDGLYNRQSRCSSLYPHPTRDKNKRIRYTKGYFKGDCVAEFVPQAA